MSNSTIVTTMVHVETLAEGYHYGRKVAGMSMTRDEMVETIEKVLSGDLRDEEIDEALVLLRRYTGCPNISDMIFYSDPPLSPEGVIETALAQKPTILS